MFLTLDTALVAAHQEEVRMASTSGPVPVTAAEIEQLDLEIIALLRRRCELAGDLPTERGQPSMFPISFRVDDTVGLYEDALGPPGELVARAVLNVSRAAQLTERFREVT
jgi:hypothetical protein